MTTSRWAVEPVLRARSQPGDPESWKRNSRKMQRGKPGQSNYYCWVNRIKIVDNTFPVRCFFALQLHFRTVDFPAFTILMEENSPAAHIKCFLVVDTHKASN